MLGTLPTPSVADLTHDAEDLLLVDQLVVRALGDLVVDGVDLLGLRPACLDVDVGGGCVVVQRAGSGQCVDVADLGEAVGLQLGVH